MLKNSGLNTKVLIVFLGISLIPFSLISVVASSFLHESIKQHAFNQWMLFIGVFTMLLASGLAFWVSRSLASPVVKLTTMCECIARGDFEHPIDIAQPAELKCLAQSIVSLRDALRERINVLQQLNTELNQWMVQHTAELETLQRLIQHIIKTAEQLGAASAGMTHISTQMAADAKQTSQQVHLVSSHSLQISQRFQHVSVAIEEVAASIREISRNVHRVTDIMTRAVETTDSANTTMASLETRSQAIGKIIRIITDIAQQTNLLALNATIEAARAGELGQGFTVVAHEVKALARETTASASEITDNIAMIQSTSQDAAVAISEVANMTNQAAELIHTIAATISQQSHASEEISLAIADAARGSEEITHAMSEAATVVQHSSERAGNVHEAALKLSLLADQLHLLVADKKKEYATFETYKQYALTGKPYPDEPGKGKRLAFANNAEAYFCDQVQQGLVTQAKLAGFYAQDLMLLNNKYDPQTGIANAEAILARKPDIFIEFQADSAVNKRVGQMFTQANIPVIAIDIPIPQAPMVGIDNYGVATLAGRAMGEQITAKLGGLERVDLIVLLQNPDAGEVVMLRSEGFADALQAMFGAEVNQKIIRVNGGIGSIQEAELAMSTVLKEYSRARRIAFTGVNDQMVKGAIDALKKVGRWNPTDMVPVPLGLDQLGQQMLREGLADVGIAFFPERYGEVILPAVLTILKGEAVPKTMYVPSEILTKETLGKYYRQSVVSGS
jgi:methyl-accepting chemotaxis protein/ABC-type sugar transport system substrate-binding protein